MKPITLDHEIWAGADGTSSNPEGIVFRWLAGTPQVTVNLTGYEFQFTWQAGATVKRYVGSHDGTAQTGDILIDLAAAEVKVPISREDTRLIESAATEALYQIEYRIGGVQRIFMSGKLNLVGSGINDDS